MSDFSPAHLPPILYGTAWKEDLTATFTAAALQAGFRGIDTANQRKHYCEAAVGNATADAIATGHLERGELYLQTKFTRRDAQDHRLPYDPTAPIHEQVKQSFASSLAHLQTNYIDSYLLHGPSTRSGLAKSDWDAWNAIELLHDSQQARAIGVSNFNIQQLRLLVERAQIKPHFVQNRCYASQGWDRDVREFCRSNGIVYQGFSLLTANQNVLALPIVEQIAARSSCSAPQVIFRFSHAIGILPLTGTTKESHLRDDLDIDRIALSAVEIAALEHAAG